MMRTVQARPEWLTFAVIYHNAADYPGMYVVREWKVNPASAGLHPAVWPVYVGKSRDAARLAIAREWPGLVRVDRHPSDEAAILETWV